MGRNLGDLLYKRGVCRFSIFSFSPPSTLTLYLNHKPFSVLLLFLTFHASIDANVMGRWVGLPMFFQVTVMLLRCRSRIIVCVSFRLVFFSTFLFASFSSLTVLVSSTLLSFVAVDFLCDLSCTGFLGMDPFTAPPPCLVGSGEHCKQVSQHGGWVI